MYAFSVFILILLAIYILYNPASYEGFEDTGTASARLPPIKPAEPIGLKVEQPWAYSNVNAPVNATPPVQTPPPVRNAGQEPMPSDLPGQVPAAPYLQIARTDPRPFEDPTLLKTTRQRIAEVQERLKGFLAFKAQLISDRSDPQIQMPLSAARADFERLKATLNVLSRNPSIQPTQTEQQMNEIDDNLAYLVHEAEKVQSLAPEEEMPAPLKPSIFEGFEDATSMSQPQPQTQPQPQPQPVSNYSLPSTVANMGISDMEHSPAEKARKNSDKTSLQDLNDFIGRVEAEQKRLSRSGTTDPIIQARLDGLNRIKNDVRDIVNKVGNKQMREDEIPIKKSEIKNALLQIKQGNIPATLSLSSSNNLPTQAQHTALQTRMPGVKNLPPGALEQLAKQTQVSISYTDTLYGIMKMFGIPGMDTAVPVPESAQAAPPLPNPVTNRQVISELYETKTRHALDGSTVATYTGLTEDECQKSCSDDDQCDGYNFRWGNTLNPECTLRQSPTKFTMDLYTDAGRKTKAQSAQGFTDMSSKPAVFSQTPTVPYPMRTTDWVYNGGEAAVLGSVGHFDWRERSKQITDQIRKRNMNPREFGALKDGSQVSPDFSWKGYSQMLCTRLAASYDTGLAVACGCPPMEWPGWQSPMRA